MKYPSNSTCFHHKTSREIIETWQLLFDYILPCLRCVFKKQCEIYQPLNMCIYAGLKRRHILHHPVITSQIQSSGLPSAMLSVIQCSIVRLRKKLFAHAQQTSAMQDKWREYAV